MVNPDVDNNAKTLNHRKIIRKRKKQQPAETQTNTKTEILLQVAVRFSHLDCQGGILHHCLPSVTSLATIAYIVFAYSKLSLLYCNKKRDGGIALIIGGPASCLINLCFVELILGWKGGNAFSLIVTKQW